MVEGFLKAHGLPALRAEVERVLAGPLPPACERPHNTLAPLSWGSSIFEALGIEFDLDPAAPAGDVPWVPARAHYSKVDDGLARPWFGRVWLNPPYGRDVDRWMRRLVGHGDGLALVFARSDTRWFSRSLANATAIGIPTEDRCRPGCRLPRVR
jgi:hypothetical protein